MALHPREQHRKHNRQLALALDPTGDAELPIDRIADTGIGLDAAYELIKSELLLDGQARLNLATFVGTWMPSIGTQLMAETADKNMIDKDEYPQTAEIESRCVNILADLWNSPERESATGCSTTGSSEAGMLAGMALKWRWRQRMEAAGKPADRPNLVMGANVQVCWEKFCRYWEVEPRLVPMEGETYHLTADRAVAQCDENTIGVVAILGSTFDGSYEPVKEIADALDQLEAERGINVPMHVDAASGGFVAPFLTPDLEWDFRVDRVQSINASGHKYGLVYPGVGWAVWRDTNALPRQLVFDVNYLGGNMPTFSLNFSRPGSEVIAQYFMFMSLGRAGYTAMIGGLQEVAMHTAKGVAELGPYRLISEGRDLPVFAFALAPEVTNYSVFDVSERLRERGWLVPAYTFPENRQDLSVLRVVVRAGMHLEMADELLEHLAEKTKALQALTAPMPDAMASRARAFAH
ncbi:MAG TPA: glutamate decarboxylase [Solirubrobacteraceae bacterium]|jgi:glutamate decarboxylase|nr:glutamate decarboxylase [Solirubrobacteraceae bacterium]